MNSLEKVNNEVYVAQGSFVCFGDEEVEFLKEQARSSPRRRSRICAHSSNEDTLHEMLIAILANSYIHPHRHLGKSESFHVVEGMVDVVIFDDGGSVAEVVELGARGSGRQFFYRLSVSRFHTLLIRTDHIVIHEVTNGPLTKDATILASFAPLENEPEKVQKYLIQVSNQAAEYLSKSIA